MKTSEYDEHPLRVFCKHIWQDTTIYKGKKQTPARICILCYKIENITEEETK
jgi:hypothetical protein